MSHWKLVRPAAFTNLIENPAPHEDGASGWTWTTAGTWNISEALGPELPTIFGPHVLETESGASNSFIAQSPAVTLTAVQHYASAWIYLPDGWTGGAASIVMQNLTSHTEDVTTHQSTTTTGEWVKLWILFTPDAGDLVGNLRIDCASNPGANELIYTGGYMLGVASAEQTYVDGEQPGCFWNGARYASTSSRIETDRRGGDILDLDDDLYFTVDDELGTGMFMISNTAQALTLNGGALYDNARIEPREISLKGSFNIAAGATVSNFHTRRQALLKALYTRTGTNVEESPLPVLVRYDGGGVVQREIGAYYQSGLNNGPTGAGVRVQDEIRLFAPDPFFKGWGRGGGILDVGDSGTFRAVAHRRALHQDIAA